MEKSFLKEYAELKHENDRLQQLYQDEHCTVLELQKVNERLKEEIKINLQRANALNRELNQLQTCLQEIKGIAEYIMTSDTEKWTLDEPFKQIEKILDLITKVESEG